MSILENGNINFPRFAGLGGLLKEIKGAFELYPGTLEKSFEVRTHPHVLACPRFCPVYPCHPCWSCSKLKPFGLTWMIFGLSGVVTDQLYRVTFKIYQLLMKTVFMNCL